MMPDDHIILAPGGIIDECPGGEDALKKTYEHEENPRTGMWAFCPECQRWYQGPANVGVPYAHTREGWITSSDDNSVPYIDKIWPNYSIPTSHWRGAAKAWKILRVIGLANGAREPIGGMPTGELTVTREGEVSGDNAVDIDKFAKATQRGIVKTHIRGQVANRAQRRAEEREKNRNRARGQGKKS